MPGRVLESKKPTWVSDVTIDKNFPRAPAALEAGLRGGFAFPLMAGGKVNGVLELFSPTIVQPDEDLLQLVEALGSQIGLFIQRRRVEQELHCAKENAEAANAAKDRFLATLSHELRTPLNPVLIWAGGTMNQPGLSPDIQEGLQLQIGAADLHERLGLGLSISKAIIQMHGGSIRAESAGPGKGAIFAIDLPLGRADLTA